MKTPAVKGETDSLNAVQWVAGTHVLPSEQGIDGVRKELPAKRWRAKGSVYWYFQDRDSLHQSILSHWRRQATVALIERLERGLTRPEVRLRKLLRVPILDAVQARPPMSNLPFDCDAAAIIARAQS